MNLHAFFHAMESEWAYPLDKERFFLRLRTARGDARSVTVHYSDEYLRFHGREGTGSLDLELACSDELFDYWEGIVQARGLITFYYQFQIMGHDSSTVWFARDRLGPKAISASQYHFVMSALLPGNVPQVPGWASTGLVYQVFPERFARGRSSSLQPGQRREFLDWHDPAVSWRDFLGGNLAGIRDHLDHIASLGTTIIYLTPVFRSDSSHKYNTFDYFSIDPDFGTLDDLQDLVASAHALGIRVILDAVFNHTGLEFAPFRDLCERGQDSPYRDWFTIRRFPVAIKDFPDYETYGYYGYMPKVRGDNPAVRDYFCQVGRYWIEQADIDGWRIDVAPEQDHEFWRAFRRAVHEAKADALIVGELWHDAAPWLRGDQFDSTMNYPLAAAIHELLVGNPPDPARDHDRLGALPLNESRLGKVEAFARTVATLGVKYSKAHTHALWNLIDSHDTSRFLSEAGGDKRLLRLASFLQFTHPGLPMVYYGDEVGMEGLGDSCRRGMVWDSQNQDAELLAWYRLLGRLRRQCPALNHGDWRLWQANDQTGFYAWWRVGAAGTPSLLAMVNVHDRASLGLERPRLPGTFGDDLLQGMGGAQCRDGGFDLPPRSALLLETRP